MSSKNKKWKMFKGIFSNGANSTSNTQNERKTEPEEVEKVQDDEEFVITESTHGVIEIEESTNDVFVLDPEVKQSHVTFDPNEDSVNNHNTSDKNIEHGGPVQDTPESKNDIFVIEPTEKDYQILEIDEDFTDDEVKRQYWTLAKKYHPDNGGDPKKFMRLRKAYEKVLKYRAS